MFDNKIFFSVSWFTFEIVLTESIFSKTNETILSNCNSLEFMISSIVQSKTTIAFDRLRLKNRKLIKAEKVAIEAMFNRKN